MAKIDDAGINDSLRSLGFSSATTSKDQSGAAYKVFAGYGFNRYLAIEGGYFDLGKFGFRSIVLPPGSLSADVKVRGVNLDALVSYPFTDGFSVFARVGVLRAESKDRYSGSGSVVVLQPETKENKTSWKAGLGVSYEFANGLGLRAEWERYNVADGTKTDNKADADVFGVSFYYRFQKGSSNAWRYGPELPWSFLGPHASAQAGPDKGSRLPRCRQRSSGHRVLLAQA